MKAYKKYLPNGDTFDPEAVAAIDHRVFNAKLTNDYVEAWSAEFDEKLNDIDAEILVNALSSERVLRLHTGLYTKLSKSILLSMLKRPRIFGFQNSNNIWHTHQTFDFLQQTIPRFADDGELILYTPISRSSMSPVGKLFKRINTPEKQLEWLGWILKGLVASTLDKIDKWGTDWNERSNLPLENFTYIDNDTVNVPVCREVFCVYLHLMNSKKLKHKFSDKELNKLLGIPLDIIHSEQNRVYRKEAEKIFAEYTELIADQDPYKTCSTAYKELDAMKKKFMLKCTERRESLVQERNAKLADLKKTLCMV